jgi:hypothetical protein
MTETNKADAPQSQPELSEEQLDTAVGGTNGSLADGRYTLMPLRSSITDGTSNIKDGTSNTVLVGEIR